MDKQAPASRSSQKKPSNPASLQYTPEQTSPTGRHSEAEIDTVHEKDALTGLPRQAYLCRAVDKCLEQSRKHKLAATLALLQLENFYEIRAWVGKSEANLLLSDIAHVLKDTLPKNVLLGRCHNYEFAALLIDDRSVNARVITNKVKQALLSTVSPSIPPQLELKCSVGLASMEPNIPSWPVVFARARHNISLAHYHRELPTHLVSISPESALQQLQTTVQKIPLPLSFQATVNLVGQGLKHYEVRCPLSQDENKLPTALLFETAARNALGEQLDQQIIEQVWGLLSTLNQSDLCLWINLSHNSIVSTQFLQNLENKLAKNPALASQLVFQISEIDVLIAQHHIAYFCELLEQQGSRIAVSNFGCTPNPLRYLSLVPASYVKLDTGMLKKISSNQEIYEATATVTKELHARGLKVVAPMVQELSVVEFLWRAKIDFVQGNCLHAPTSSMNFEFSKPQTLMFSRP